MRNLLRRKLQETLDSKRLDKVPGVQAGRSLARALLGGAASQTPPTPEPPPPPRPREPAPVMLYVEWDSPGRGDVERVLTDRGIPYKVLSVDRDENTKAFLQQMAGREPPVLFIATDPVGWLEELEALDLAGELHKRVFGA